MYTRKYYKFNHNYLLNKKLVFSQFYLNFSKIVTSFTVLKIEVHSIEFVSH